MNSTQNPTQDDRPLPSSRLDVWRMATALSFGIVMVPFVVMTAFFVLPVLAAVVLGVPMFMRPLGSSARHLPASGHRAAPPPLPPMALPQADPA